MTSFRHQFFKRGGVKKSERISTCCSAVDAYDIFETITFVKEGKKVN